MSEGRGGGESGPPAGRDEPVSPPHPADRAERLRAPDQRPATVASLKSLRRWLIVAGVWAVAATAIAVFALMEANEAGDAGREEAAGDLSRVQRQLDDRIDELERSSEQAPSSEDIGQLDDRLTEIESGSAQTSQDIERLNGRLDDLEQQVRALEDGTETLGGGDTETTP
jgi:septal ring factor EnvC (AmiA/AmiB activator)